VLENSTVGSSIGRVHASDSDEGNNALIAYSFLRSGGGVGGDCSGAIPNGTIFSLDIQTGSIVLRAGLDYELCSEYGLGVVATDHGSSPLSGYSRLVVRVVDVNDHSPVITINSLTSGGQVQLRENEPVGAFVAHVMVSDRDSESRGKVYI